MRWQETGHDVLNFHIIGKHRLRPCDALDTLSRSQHFGKRLGTLLNSRSLHIFGVIHKPRGHLRGDSQMTILLHKLYLIKGTTKGGGEGGSKIPQILTTWFMDVPLT